MTGAPARRAPSGEVTTGRSSYVTWMRLTASAASSGVSAATAATSSRIHVTLSFFSAVLSLPNPKDTSSMSEAVSTARTPSTALAAETSMLRIRAWGRSAKRILPYSMRGSLMSSIYRARPVAFSGASSLGIRFPIRDARSVVVDRSDRTSAADSAIAGASPCQRQHGIHYLTVSGTAAQIPLQAAPDIGLTG